MSFVGQVTFSPGTGSKVVNLGTGYTGEIELFVEGSSSGDSYARRSHGLAAGALQKVLWSNGTGANPPKNGDIVYWVDASNNIILEAVYQGYTAPYLNFNVLNAPAGGGAMPPMILRAF